MKKLTVASGPFEWKVIALREGLMLKMNVPNQPNKQHVTFLCDSVGRITLHSSDEQFPKGSPHRNKHFMALDTNEFSKQMSAHAEAVKALIEAETPRTLIPDLSGTKLMEFPVVPADFSQVVTMSGQNGRVDLSQIGGVNVIDAVQLNQSTCSSFLVFRKSGRNWSSRGLLIKSVGGAARMFLRNTILDQFFQAIASIVPIFPKRYPRMRFTQAAVRSMQRASPI